METTDLVQPSHTRKGSLVLERDEPQPRPGSTALCCSEPVFTARAQGSELCQGLPRGTRQTMEASERKPGCICTDLSFQSVTLAPRGSRAWGGQVEENTAGAAFQSDYAVGLAAT